MKLLISLKNRELSKFLEFTNSFLIGLKNYSINYFELDIDEIKELLEKYPEIELFISINKNIFNEDLNSLKEKLISISKLKIKGIMFYDLSVLNLVKKLNLNIDLIIHQNHLITNYNICNFYLKHQVKTAYLSTEITVSEIKEIKEKTNINLIAYLIGHPIITHSKRKLLSNYYNYLKKEPKLFNIIKEKNQLDEYYIIENDLGTNILPVKVLNGTLAFLELKNILEYAVLDNNLIDDEIFLEIVKLYTKSLKQEITSKELVKQVEKLIGNYEGLLFNKTIYKVKNEKN